MFNRSLKHTILLNVAAFLLVLILEILSIWTVKDKFDTDLAFYLHSLGYATIIMIVIWINHFVLVPFLLDHRRYVLYALLLIGIIFLMAYSFIRNVYKLTSISFRVGRFQILLLSNLYHRHGYGCLSVA